MPGAVDPAGYELRTTAVAVADELAAAADLVIGKLERVPAALVRGYRRRGRRRRAATSCATPPTTSSDDAAPRPGGGSGQGRDRRACRYRGRSPAGRARPRRGRTPRRGRRAPRHSRALPKAGSNAAAGRHQQGVGAAVVRAPDHGCPAPARRRAGRRHPPPRPAAGRRPGRAPLRPAPAAAAARGRAPDSTAGRASETAADPEPSRQLRRGRVRAHEHRPGRRLPPGRCGRRAPPSRPSAACARPPRGRARAATWRRRGASGGSGRRSPRPHRRRTVSA